MLTVILTLLRCCRGVLGDLHHTPCVAVPFDTWCASHWVLLQECD